MVLAREKQQFAGHALALQGGEHRQALRVRHTKILLPVNHQRRRFPFAHLVDGVEFGVGSRILVFGTGEFVFGKP